MNHELVLGLGGCVDYEIAWDSRVLEDLVTLYGLKAADLDASVPVSDERSLVASVLAFIRDGVGGERFIASSEIVEQFASRFTKRITLGGTCVRAAIAMEVLGVPATVHLVSIDDNVRRLLPRTVRYLSSATRDTLDPHLIIQFPAGTAVRAGDIDIRAPHPNRIIYTNDPPNRDLVLADDLPDALATADVFLVAGFNVMRDEAILRDRIATLNVAIRRMPAGAVVLYEDAGFHDPEMRAIVRRDLTGSVDVHSMNEDEFQHYLARSLDLLDVDQVVAALKESVTFAVADTVVVTNRSRWRTPPFGGSRGVYTPPPPPSPSAALSPPQLQGPFSSLRGGLLLPLVPSLASFLSVPPLDPTHSGRNSFGGSWGPP